MAALVSCLVVLTVDRDLAGHLAVALRSYRASLERLGAAQPPGLADLEAAVVGVVGAQDASGGVTVPGVENDSLCDRQYLSRADVGRLTGASLATVDRWIGSGRLRSAKLGRCRRVARVDLDAFVAGSVADARNR
jgi:excisionase family DNA binding protein